jgi:hypothetical protein
MVDALVSPGSNGGNGARMTDGRSEHPKYDMIREAVRHLPAHSPDTICFTAFLRFMRLGFIAVRERVFPPAETFVTRQILIFDSDISFAVADNTNH